VKEILPVKLDKDKYLNSKSSEVLKVLEKHHRVLLQAPPGTGKTVMIAHWFADRSNSPFNRIVFMAPLIVIQEQFKTKVEELGAQIDIELNHKCRKSVDNMQMNITSTYISINKLSDKLEENDLVVVDEAHMLLTAFRQGNVVSVYGECALILKETKAKVLFLTATPRPNLKEVFNYEELFVTSEATTAPLKFYFSGSSYIDIASWFAEKVIYTNNKARLNIIYHNNIKNLEKLKVFLGDFKDWKVQMLTSDSKNTEEYLRLVEEWKVESDVQFLLTTSLIAAGASLKNDNMGEVLILENCDPIDIYQFSKRFRNKKDVPITLVNPYRWNKEDVEEPSKTRINEVRQIYGDYLTSLRKFESITYNESYHANDIGTKNDLLKRTMTRLLIEECEYLETLNHKYKKKDTLLKQLKKFNFEAHDDGFLNLSSTEDFGEKLNDVLKKKLTDKILDFEARPSAFLKAIEIYADSDKDYQCRELFKFNKKRFDIEFKNEKEDESINQKLNEPFFLKNILRPFLESYSYFNSTSDTLNFLKLVQSPNERSWYLLQKQIINDLESYFEQTTTESKPQIKKNVNFKDLSDKETFSISLIEAVINQLETNPFYDHRSISQKILDNVYVKYSSTLNEAPFGVLKKDRKSYKHNKGYKIEANSLTKKFTKFLVTGIIYMDTKRINKTNINIPSNIKVPRQNLPKIKNTKNISKWKVNEFKYSAKGVISHMYLMKNELFFHSFKK